MKNPYKIHLNNFFEIITDFRHSSNRLNKVLLNDVKKYTSENSKYSSVTSLIIGDWTSQTDNGWKLSYHTGVNKITLKENYSSEINRVLSRQFGFAFSQCYEALETLLKDMVFIKINTDKAFKISLPKSKNYSRHHLRGGDDIFKLIKKAGGTKFQNYSKKNNSNFKFKEIYKILSEVRHALTHSKGVLKTSKIPKDDYYQRLFEHLFPLNKLNKETVQLKFDFKVLNQLLVYLAEFGFQIFKILSEEDNYEWKI